MNVVSSFIILKIYWLKSSFSALVFNWQIFFNLASKYKGTVEQDKNPKYIAKG